MDLWVEKYRPTTLEEYIGNETIKNKIADYLKQRSIQNLLFHGVAGTMLTTECTVVDDPEEEKKLETTPPMMM